MNGRDRTDFRLARLERRVYGTQTPTGGTDAGVAIQTPDLLTRINELESAIGAALPLLTVSAAPSNASGSNGQWAHDSVNEHLYFKVGGTWRQIQ